MLRTIPIPESVQAPLTVNTTGQNAGNWKSFLKARYDSEPTDDDVLAASASIGYGSIMRCQGGYLIGNIKKVVLKEDDDLFWIATWEAIAD